MAKDLAKIVVALEAESAKLMRELDRANGQLQRFGKKADTVSAGFKRAMGVIGAALAGVSFKNMIDSAVEAASVARNLSTRLGGTVEEWSRLSYAATQADIKFREAAIALQRMTRRISEAAHGSGEAIGALNELGLSAERMADLTPVQQMQVFADALQNVERRTDRVRIAQKLFDSEGVKMLQLLEGGAQHFRDLAEQSDRFGTTLSRNAAERMAQYEQAMKDLDAASQGFSNQLATALGPTLAEMAHWMGDVLPAAAKTLGSWMNALAEQTRTTAQWFAAYQMGEISFWEWFTAGNEEAAQKLRELHPELYQAATGVGEVANTVGEFKVGADAASLAIERFAGRNERAAKAVKQVAEVTGELRDEWDYVLDIYIREEEQNQRRWAEVQAGILKVVKAAKAVKTEAKATRTAWDELGGTFSSAFEDAIVSGGRLSDVLRAIGQDIERILVRKTITEPLTSAVSSFAADNSGTIAGFIGGLFGGFRAAGGPVSAGTAYVVGERGPELFVPRQSGAIVPNGAALVAPAAPGVTINITNNAQAQVRTAEQTGPDGSRQIDVIIEQIESRMVGSVQRGGALAQAIEGTYGLNRAAGAY